VNNQTNKPEKEKGKFDGGKEEGEKVQKHTHPKRKKGREKKTTFAFGWTRSSDQYRVLIGDVPERWVVRLGKVGRV